MEVRVDRELDAKGLKCPMPVMKLRSAMDGMSEGEVIRVETTDRGSIPDFNAWTRRTGNEILEQDEEDGRYIFLIRKGA